MLNNCRMHNLTLNSFDVTAADLGRAKPVLKSIFYYSYLKIIHNTVQQFGKISTL